jgi:hypothetical protein
VLTNIRYHCIFDTTLLYDLKISRSPSVGSYNILSIRTQFKDIKIISWTQFNYIKVARTQFNITVLFNDLKIQMNSYEFIVGAGTEPKRTGSGTQELLTYWEREPNFYIFNEPEPSL